MMQVDYLIIGQGISGTLLSYELYKLGKSFVVIDDGNIFSSSRIASGLINPVTGKRYVKSWKYDELLTAALQTYRELEQLFNVPLVEVFDMLQFHQSVGERELFESKAKDEPHLNQFETDAWSEYFSYYFGMGRIAPCYIINGQELLSCWRSMLCSLNALKEECFSWSDCMVQSDQIKYKEISASKIFCCDGVSSYHSPYFSRLPFSLNKGEVIIADIPHLPQKNIYKAYYKIIPLGNGLFWIGSSFEWKYDNVEPSVSFREKVSAYLQQFLKLPFSILQHDASERPSSVDYRPFVGIHPRHNTIGILNGMGTKGFLQAPYFSKQLAAHVCNYQPIMAEADVIRFKNVLSAGL